MRLIDADKLMIEFEVAQKAADQHGREFTNCFYDASGEISTNWFCVEDMVDNAPTVDAVPVVRCGECRYWDRFPSCSATPQYHACKRRIFATNVHTMRDEFCSQGERKDGDHHEG